MIAEAIDTAVTLGWALAAWIAVAAFVAAVVLLGGTAVGMWAVKRAWRIARAVKAPRRGLSAPVAASEPECVPREPQPAERPSAPSWARDPHDTGETPKPPVPV